MNRNITIRLLILLAVLVAARLAQVLTYPRAVGKFRDSPDGQFTARAMSVTDNHFFSGTRRYYEFVVEAGPREHPRREARRIVIDAPPEGMMSWREQGSITWSADSSQTTYSFQSTQLTIILRP